MQKTLDLPPSGGYKIKGKEVIRLKINEVEALVGITKKNIRFYEERACYLPAAIVKTATGTTAKLR